MAKLRYIKGAFLLENNVEDPNAYYNLHKSKIDAVIKWANDLGIYVGFGISSDNTYLCEYNATGNTSKMCKGIAAELKSRLKTEWKKVELGYQAEGYFF